MKKSFIVVAVILLILTYTIASTYAVIIDITDTDGESEIVNVIKIRDLFTREDGSYNKEYYNVVRELDITEEEASLLMDSEALNDRLAVVLRSIVDYKYHKKDTAKLDNDELYNMIIEGVYLTPNISDILRDKIKDKALIYREDISDFVYDIDGKVIFCKYFIFNCCHSR